MRYELNFWPALDWRRESSIDPRFLIGAAVCLVMVGILAVWSLSYVSLQARKSELEQVTAANEKIIKEAKEVIRQDECIRHWKKILNKGELKKNARMPWSRQMAAFATVVPETMIFDGIIVNSAPVRIELPEPPVVPGTDAPSSKKVVKKPKTVVRLQYDLTLTGVAIGDNADEIISRFSREIPLQPELSFWIESVELTGVQPKADAYNKMPGKKFSLVCRYKPLDWYDDPGQKQIKQ